MWICRLASPGTSRARCLTSTAPSPVQRSPYGRRGDGQGRHRADCSRCAGAPPAGAAERPVARVVPRYRVCTSPFSDGRTHRAESCSRERQRRRSSRTPATGSTRLSVVYWNQRLGVRAPHPRVRQRSSRRVHLNPSGNCIWNVLRPSHHLHNRLPMGDLCKSRTSHRTPRTSTPAVHATDRIFPQATTGTVWDPRRNSRRCSHPLPRRS